MKVQSSPDVVAERIKKVAALKAKGLNITEICKEMGLPKSTVNYYMYHDLYQKHGKRPKAKRGVVSVLGSPTMNGKVHHEWFVAGWIASYATINHLDVAGLLVDVDDVLKGKAHE